MKDNLRLSVVNFIPDSGNVAYNVDKIIDYTVSSAEEGCDLILFPELCVQGYDCMVGDSFSPAEKVELALAADDEMLDRIRSTSVANNIITVFGVAEKSGETLYNSAIIFMPTGYVHVYRKIHLFDDEKQTFIAGDKPLYFSTDWGNVGIGICYDSYQFPEIARYCASKGCRLYLNPTALVEEIDKAGSRESFLNYYSTTLDYIARVNTMYVASSNLSGRELTNYFGGGSYIVGPKIDPFYETDIRIYGGDPESAEEGCSMADIDLSLATLRIFRKSEYDGMSDYRPDVYKTFE